MLAEFSLKRLYSTMCGKNVQIYRVQIPGKCVDSRYFYSCSSPLKNRPPPSPGSCHHTLDQNKLLIPLCSTLSKICLPQQQKGAEEAVIYFIKNQSENMKMT